MIGESPEVAAYRAALTGSGGGGAPRSDVDAIQEEIPGWVVAANAIAFVALSPDYEHDGLSVTALDGAELIRRVREIVQVIALAQDRAGRLRPRTPVGGVWTGEESTPAKEPPTSTAAAEAISDARVKGYTGGFCPACNSMAMVRNGACEKCVDCGETTGCS